MSFLRQQIANSSYRESLESVLSLAVAPGVCDLIANAPDDWWLDEGSGLERVAGFSVPEGQYSDIARMLVTLTGRHVDLVTPLADGPIDSATLPELIGAGVSRLRVHVALAGQVSQNTLISIRVHRSQSISLNEICSEADAGPATFERLRRVAYERQNFIVCGPAGAGKTTLLRALLSERTDLRSVLVEDTAEIAPLPGHAVSLQCRQPNTEGAGEISLDNLLRNALRMRPDRIVVGEVRGGEASVLLQAMNSGHAGSAATLHANSLTDAPSRLTALAVSGGLPHELAQDLVSSAQIEFIRVSRRDDGQRVIELAAPC